MINKKQHNTLTLMVLISSSERMEEIEELRAHLRRRLIKVEFRALRAVQPNLPHKVQAILHESLREREPMSLGFRV